jgi:sulfate permease, SulP family
MAILLLWPRVSRRVPAPFVALVAATAVVSIFHLPVETIGDRFGEIHATFPAPRIPSVSFEMLRGLISPAFTIAMLAGIDSLLSAAVADGMIGGRHRSNMELVARGVANIVSPIVGGLPGTGAIARTATSIKNGGRTPIAGMAHAVTLLVIMLFFGKLTALIPMAVLAAILVIVSYNMSQWRSFVA